MTWIKDLLLGAMHCRGGDETGEQYGSSTCAPAPPASQAGGDIGGIVDGSATDLHSATATKVRTYAFYGSTLKTVDFPAASIVESRAFQECKALVSANLPNVTSIGDYSFRAATSLTTVNCPKVKTMGTQVFKGCSKLTSVECPDVTSIGSSAFDGTNIERAHFPKLEKVPGDMCSYCTNLKSVEIPSATNIDGYAFQGCTLLSFINLPLVKQIGTQSFYDCKALTTVVLPGDTVVTLVNSMAFTGTPIAAGTGYVYIPAALLDSYKAAKGWTTYAAQLRALEDYTVDGTTTGALDESKI